MIHLNELGAMDPFPLHSLVTERYTHMVSTAILFGVSLLCIAYLHPKFRKAGVEWPAIIHGFVYIGVIGLGEFVEHFFRWDPFLDSSFHYFHHIASPIALIFLYLGITEYHDKCSHPNEEIHTISNEVAMGVFAGSLTVAIIMGYLSLTPVGRKLGGLFFILIIVSILVTTIFIIKIARRITKSMLASYFPALGISLSVLTIEIWLARFAHVYNINSLLILSQSLQSILHTITATIMVLFVLAVRESIKEDILYTSVVTEKSKLKKQRKRDFRVDEQ